MRARRLLTLLLMLQSRGRLTAREMAGELDVSIRTIYRDMDALTGAGVPIYADRGPDGGYTLLEGYRTQLTGLSAAEAEALTGPSSSDAAAELGLSRVLAAAQLKVAAALPTELSDRAGRLAERFHLDAPGWFAHVDDVPTLTGLADAIWNQRALRVRYRRADEPGPEREIEPLGLVLKAGTWYLVAGPGAPCSYRVAGIVELETLDARFERPADFDLWAHWHRRTAEPVDAPYQAEATVRLSPRGRDRAPLVLRPHTARALDRAPDGVDADGWTVATVPIESLAHARDELLALGGEVEVLAPPVLRELMRDAVADLVTLYG